jgi:hypothetical protein
MFYNEFDLLDIRLNELWDVVDKFILVECPTTHRNFAKPLYFDERKADYKKYSDKIIHVVKDLPISDNAWIPENEHRRGIIDALKHLAPKENDYLIISDADEIPRAETIKNYHGDLALLAMDFFYYKYNLKAPFTWNLSKMVRIGAMEYDINDYRKELPNCDILRNAGWHFSKMYSLEQIKFMFKNALADELGHDEIINNLEDWYNKGESHWCGHDNKFDRVPIDNTYPEYFLKHIEQFKEFIL